MLHTAKTQPATFFAVCARLIGPEVKITLEQSLPGNLSAQDWQVMREIVEAVKLAVPDASSKPPGEVLEYVRAKLIDFLCDQSVQEALKCLAKSSSFGRPKSIVMRPVGPRDAGGTMPTGSEST